MDMELSMGKKVATDIMETLKPFCDRMMVVGSIRREKIRVNNIDILVIPRNQGQLAVALQGLGRLIKQDKGLYSCFFQGYECHIWVTFPDKWAVAQVMRTGSEAHNERLIRLAEKQGLKLRKDGTLTKESDGGRFEVKSEQELFACLETPYLEPKDREVAARKPVKKA